MSSLQTPHPPLNTHTTPQHYLETTEGGETTRSMINISVRNNNPLETTTTYARTTTTNNNMEEGGSTCGAVMTESPSTVMTPLHLMKPLDDFGMYSYYPGEESATSPKKHENNVYAYPGEEIESSMIRQQPSFDNDNNNHHRDDDYYYGGNYYNYDSYRYQQVRQQQQQQRRRQNKYSSSPTLARTEETLSKLPVAQPVVRNNSMKHRSPAPSPTPISPNAPKAAAPPAVCDASSKKQPKHAAAAAAVTPRTNRPILFKRSSDNTFETSAAIHHGEDTGTLGLMQSFSSLGTGEAIYNHSSFSPASPASSTEQHNKTNRQLQYLQHSNRHQQHRRHRHRRNLSNPCLSGLATGGASPLAGRTTTTTTPGGDDRPSTRRPMSPPARTSSGTTSVQNRLMIAALKNYLPLQVDCGFPSTHLRHKSIDRSFYDDSDDEDDDGVSTISDQSNVWEDLDESKLDISNDCDDNTSRLGCDSPTFSSWTIDVVQEDGLEGEPSALTRNTPWFRLSSTSSSTASTDYIMLEGSEVLQAIKALVSYIMPPEHYHPALPIFHVHLVSQDVTSTMSAREALQFFQKHLSKSILPTSRDCPSPSSTATRCGGVGSSTSPATTADEDASTMYFVERFVHNVRVTFPAACCGNSGFNSALTNPSIGSSTSSFPIDLIYDYE